MKSTETRVVKTFPTKTSRDVGMVLCVSRTQWHGKTNWRKNVRNKEGYHSMQQPPNHTGQHSLASRHFGYTFTIPTSGNILMHPLPTQVTSYNKLHWHWPPNNYYTVVWRSEYICHGLKVWDWETYLLWGSLSFSQKATLLGANSIYIQHKHIHKLSQ